jgi:hypothetical protein
MSVSRTIAAFCIIDDALQAMGHKDDPQTKVVVSRCMCKRLCTGGIPLLKHLL